MEKSIEGLTADQAESPTTRSRYAAPTTGTERIFVEVLADVVRVEQVSVDSHFFDDLGANSLVMAQFCARVRKRADLPSVSIKDVYQHPTIRSLATALADSAPTPVESSVPATIEEATRASTLQYVLCGVLQLLIFLGYAYLTGLVIAEGYDWVSVGSGWIDIYLRSVLFGGALFVGLCCFPIVAKWILVGRWQASEFPVWGLTYMRFWVVKALVHANPMAFFVGTPLYVLYLRALGARIGKGVTILSPTIPVCTDLLMIGSGTVIRKNSSFLCYRAHAGRIQTGPVTLGRDVYIGEKTVLDINTSMGDGAQLGHTSSLQSGQEVPDGQHWHGSPAQRTQLDYLRVAPANCGTLRRFSFGLGTLLMVFLVYMPLLVGGSYMLFTLVPALDRLLGPDTGKITSPELYIDALVLSLVSFFGFVIIGLVFVFTVPRLLNLAIKPDKVYPFYGFHYALHLAIAAMTNSKFFNWLFGDSSYIVHYLRCLGYDLSQVEQTGANFGTVVQHDTPYLTSVGKGTIACDALSIINADFSSTSFCVSRVSIGAHNFLGNDLAFPSGARTGDNCLLATKVMIPLDGKVREGVGLLGSPCFEIPRSVERDSRFDHLRTGDELRRRLATKNRYNIRTMGLFLFIQWLHVFALSLLGLAAIDLYNVFGSVTITADLTLSLVFSVAYNVLVERAIMGFRSLRPQYCSIYEPYYWWHERLWKVPDPFLNAFNGTPFKNVIWRLLGVRIGNRVFDDGASFTERTLTIIGNDCTLNAGSHIQCHSLEDGTFKSDHTTLGAGCTLGVLAFVHYGVTMGDGAVLAADSFLMKGEEIPPHAQWGGNPARALANYQVGSITESAPVQLVAHHMSSPGQEEQRDHLDDHAHLAEQNTTDVHVCRDNNYNPGEQPWSAARSTGANAEWRKDSMEKLREDLMGKLAEADRQFWSRVLTVGGFTAIPRWTLTPVKGMAEHEAPIPGDLVATVRQLADELAIPLSSVLLAAHARVLAALSGESEVTTGYVAGAGDQPLPCRLTTASDSWRTLLLATYRVEAELLSHKDFPVAALQRELDLTGLPFETLFDPTGDGGDLAENLVLRVGIALREGNLVLCLRYRTEALDADCAARIAGYHLTALALIAADPAAEHERQSLLSTQERHFQLEGLAGPRRELPERRVHELFEQQVEAHPDAVAALHGDRQWTYRELNARVNRLGRALLARGLRREGVVAVVTERNLDWMAAVLAIFKAGGVYLPIEPHFPSDRIATTLSRAACGLVLTELGSTTTLDQTLDALPGVQKLFIDAAYEEGHADTNLGIAVAPDQLAYIYFTSGSTGEPKGAMCEHAGMLNHMYAKIEDLQISQGQVVAQTAPQCFDISLWQLLSAQLVGGRTLLVEQEVILDVQRFVDKIIDGQVNVLQVVPSYLEVVLSSLESHPRALPDLRCVSVTGEALKKELTQRWFAAMPAIKLVNAYGLTETSDDTNHEMMDQVPQWDQVPLGRPIHNVHISIVDERLALVPLGAPGEIVFSGVCVGRGYVNDPQRTQQAFLADPYRAGQRLYRGGDYGRWLPEGKLEFLGRRDSQVKISGFRIEIGEIENTLLRVPGVRDGAVVVAERADRSRRLVAFYCGPQPLDVNVLRDRLGESLPAYMVPTVFHWRERLLLTANSKIDKKQLAALARDLDVVEEDYHAPRTPTEQRLVAAWAQVLGVPQESIGWQDHFFERGGTSLSAVRLAIVLDRAVSLKDVTGHPVLADLARLLDDRSQRQRPGA